MLHGNGCSRYRVLSRKIWWGCSCHCQVLNTKVSPTLAHFCFQNFRMLEKTPIERSPPTTWIGSLVWLDPRKRLWPGIVAEGRGAMSVALMFKGMPIDILNRDRSLLSHVVAIFHLPFYLFLWAANLPVRSSIRYSNANFPLVLGIANVPLKGHLEAASMSIQQQERELLSLHTREEI